MLPKSESKFLTRPVEDGEPKIPVAIVEDNPDDRFLGERVVVRSKYFRLVGSYENGEEAIKSPAIEQARVVLMDIRMPGMGGIACTRLLKKLLPSLIILMFTAVQAPEALKEAILAGADGFLNKPLSETQCVDAILYALAGGMPLAKGIMRRAICSFNWPLAELSLTDQQNAVVECLANGLQNKQIADELRLSVVGVKKSVHAILDKLHVSSRSEAVVRLNRRNP